MMTLREAIEEETRRYVAACERHEKHRAHIHFKTIQRLKHRLMGRA